MPTFVIKFHNEKVYQMQLQNKVIVKKHNEIKTVELPLKESCRLLHKFKVLSNFNMIPVPKFISMTFRSKYVTNNFMWFHPADAKRMPKGCQKDDPIRFLFFKSYGKCLVIIYFW